MKMREKTSSQIVICLRNTGAEDIQPGKVYRLLADDSEYLRIIDDSGEDYLYPKDFFAPISLPERVERELFPTAGD